MNIFYLDNDPKVCAEMHLDKHVVKMIIEYAQLMSTAHRVLDGYEEIEKRYVAGSLPARWRNVRVWRHPDRTKDRELMKASHINHPSAIWTRASYENYMWLYTMWCHLLSEYTYRYGKTHACARLKDALLISPKHIPIGEFTQPTPAMPDQYKVKNDSLKSYWNYYIHEKNSFAKWKNRSVPEWFSEGVMYAQV
jgi:hypothetical protein